MLKYVLGFLASIAIIVSMAIAQSDSLTQRGIGVNSSGYVGIGTTSILQQLHVKGATSDGVRIRLENNEDFIDIATDGGALQLRNTGAIVVLINDSGLVGINSTNHSEQLDVVGAVLITDSGGNGGNVPHECYRKSDACNPCVAKTVNCGSGEKVTGGGCTVDSGSAIRFSYPLSDLSGWVCNTDGGSTAVTAYAVCCDY